MAILLLNHFNYVLQCFCLCLAYLHIEINVSVQHNGGFLPGIILLTQWLLPSGKNPFKCHEEVFKEKSERFCFYSLL